MGWCGFSFRTENEVEDIMEEMSKIVPGRSRLVGVCEARQGCYVYHVVVTMNGVTEQGVKFLVCRVGYGFFSEYVTLLSHPEWEWDVGIGSRLLRERVKVIALTDEGRLFGDTAILDGF